MFTPPTVWKPSPSEAAITSARDRLIGEGQMGLAMQDDVTDATQWAIKQGLADANRIAIAGAITATYTTPTNALDQSGARTIVNNGSGTSLEECFRGS